MELVTQLLAPRNSQKELLGNLQVYEPYRLSVQPFLGGEIGTASTRKPECFLSPLYFVTLFQV